MSNQNTSIPEQRLLVAMLERGARDIFKRGKYGRQARDWIFYWSRVDFCARFSFPWVCIHLDLCPYSTRERIRNLESLGAINPNCWSMQIIDLILDRGEETEGAELSLDNHARKVSSR